MEIPLKDGNIALIVVAIMIIYFGYRFFWKKKEAIGGLNDFAFIESPNQIQIKIQLETIEDIGESGDVESMASIVWNYNEMKETIKEKDEVFSSDDLIDMVADSLTGGKKDTSDGSDSGGIVNQQSVYVDGKNVGADNEYVMEPTVEDHTAIPDGFDPVEDETEEINKDEIYGDFDDIEKSQ